MIDLSHFNEYFKSKSVHESELFLEKFAGVPNNSPSNSFSVSHFAELLSYSYQFYGFPDTTLIKNGKIIPLKHYSFAEKPCNKNLDLDKIIQLFKSGCTIKLERLERFSPQLRQLQEIASTSLGSIVRLNAYLSKFDSSSFDLHYDTHNIFCLQIEGTKEWTFYENYAEKNDTNIKSYNVPFEKRPKIPTRVIETQKGDILYFPKGTWHKTRTTSTQSLHITLGEHDFTFPFFLQWASEKMGLNSRSFQDSDIETQFSKLSENLNQNLINSFKRDEIYNSNYKSINFDYEEE